MTICGTCRPVPPFALEFTRLITLFDLLDHVLSEDDASKLCSPLDVAFSASSMQSYAGFSMLSNSALLVLDGSEADVVEENVNLRPMNKIEPIDIRIPLSNNPYMFSSSLGFDYNNSLPQTFFSYKSQQSISIELSKMIPAAQMMTDLGGEKQIEQAFLHQQQRYHQDQALDPFREALFHALPELKQSKLHRQRETCIEHHLQEQKKRVKHIHHIDGSRTEDDDYQANDSIP